MRKLIYFALVLLVPSTAEAYIGPGMGAGTIAVVLGILASIVLGLIAIVWYPMKRLFRKLFKKEKAPANGGSEGTE